MIQDQVLAVFGHTDDWLSPDDVFRTVRARTHQVDRFAVRLSLMRLAMEEKLRKRWSRTKGQYFYRRPEQGALEL